MDMMALAAVGVTAALCGVVVRQKAPELAAVLTLAACVLLLWNTLPLLETIRDVLTELADLAELSPTILRPMLQTVGLAVVTRLASSLCRDAGEGSIAAFLEIAGAAAAVLVALPLLKMVLQLVLALL
ncbi:MAG: SpoIIIAC/SpoIIIAD family protein [Clostridiales bacterium]|nr:SpoIIIAC/SpoIIIAD family protein [Clostridiales bacterium]